MPTSPALDGQGFPAVPFPEGIGAHFDSKGTIPHALLRAVALAHAGAVLRCRTGLAPAQKLVLLILADFARRGSSLTWPSAATVATLAELDLRRTRRALAELLAAGWIDVHKRGGGLHKTTVYRLNMDRLNSGARATLNSGSDDTVNSGSLDTVTAPANSGKTRGQTVAKPASNSGAGATQAVIDSTIIKDNRNARTRDATADPKSDLQIAKKKKPTSKPRLNGRSAEPHQTGLKPVADILAETIPATRLLAASERETLERRKAALIAQAKGGDRQSAEPGALPTSRPSVKGSDR